MGFIIFIIWFISIALLAHMKVFDKMPIALEIFCMATAPLVLFCVFLAKRKK